MPGAAYVTITPFREVMGKARKYLEARYDMSGKTDPQVKMSGGRKAVPVGPTARLQGVTWDDLTSNLPDTAAHAVAVEHAIS